MLVGSCSRGAPIYIAHKRGGLKQPRQNGLVTHICQKFLYIDIGGMHICFQIILFINRKKEEGTIMVLVACEGRVQGLYSWTTGFVALSHRIRCLTENQAAAHAAWLEVHESYEAASDFIDVWDASRQRA